MTIQTAEPTALKVNFRPPVGAPIWKHLLWAVVAVATVWALSKIPSTLIVFSMAWLIAYLLNPAVDRLTGERLGPIKAATRGQAVGLVAALLLGMLIAAGAMMIPQLTEQVERLISLQKSLGDPSKLPMLLREKAEPYLARVPEKYREEVMTKATHFIQESASKIGLWASQIITSVGAFLGQMLSAIFLVCSAFLISLYMLMNWHGLAGSLLEKLPRQYQREVRSLSLKLNEIFGGYLKATILTAIACMIATFISLFLLEMVTGKAFPYKGLVSFVAGLSYPIPVIGIIATSILGGVLGFVADGHVGFGIAVLATINVVNIIIDRTVQPRLMSDAIGVSELFVMFAAFAGGEVAGVWGMLLGIPVAAMGKTLFEWFHLNFLLVEEATQAAPLAHPLAEQPAAGVPLVTEAARPTTVVDGPKPAVLVEGPTPDFVVSTPQNEAEVVVAKPEVELQVPSETSVAESEESSARAQAPEKVQADAPTEGNVTEPAESKDDSSLRPPEVKTEESKPHDPAPKAGAKAKPRGKKKPR